MYRDAKSLAGFLLILEEAEIMETDVDKSCGAKIEKSSLYNEKKSSLHLSRSISRVFINICSLSSKASALIIGIIGMA